MTKVDGYAVKQVKGPFIVLPDHPERCEDEAALIQLAARKRAAGVVLAADLFAGAGGLSQGLTNAGFEVVFGVDHYAYAVGTHAARFPGLSVDWDLATAENVERVASLMKAADIEVLAGGPPCQPFSMAGRAGIRNLVERGERDPVDKRRDLWRAYLEVVTLARPKAVIMENVRGMALDDEMFILRSMIEELEQLGYSVEARVVDTWRYGVPQFRQRLILVGMRGNIHFRWPAESTEKVTVWNAIGDLPEVEGGYRPPGGGDGWQKYDGPITSFQRDMRRMVPAADAQKIFDHITRPVREDDRQAFEMMTPDTKYSELPDELRRYRADIFNDKYKRLDENDVSRTITAHIAKDGYGFIHPRQPRTLTVREAARLQTFPDDFRFSGPPSAAFKQIGNAVPVRLGEVIGRAVGRALAQGEDKGVGATEVSERLAGWYRERSAHENATPWLKSASRWKIVVCELFISNASRTEIKMLWPLIDSLEGPKIGLPVPSSTVDTIGAVFTGGRFVKRRERFLKLIEEMNAHPTALWEARIDMTKLPSINPALSNLLELAAPERDADETKSTEPVIVAKGVLRVTSRFLGEDFQSRNKESDGRISIARMLGLNDNSRDAHLALFEMAKSVCLSERPICSICPLKAWCRKYQVEDENALELAI